MTSPSHVLRSMVSWNLVLLRAHGYPRRRPPCTPSATSPMAFATGYSVPNTESLRVRRSQNHPKLVAEYAAKPLANQPHRTSPIPLRRRRDRRAQRP